MKYRVYMFPQAGGRGAQPGGTAVWKRSASIGLLLTFVCVAVRAAPGIAGAGEAPAAQPEAAAGAKAAAVADPAAKAAVPQAPVQVSADTAEYFNKEGLVVFTGNVVAVQADSTISAERMVVTFSKTESAEPKPAAGIGAPSTAQRITMIVAEKNVSLRQVDPESGKERYATGDKGVYDVDQKLMTMTGNPRVWEGKNLIVGEEMVFHLEDKKMIVKGKVNLTVYPDELKAEKKGLKKEEKKP